MTTGTIRAKSFHELGFVDKIGSLDPSTCQHELKAVGSNVRGRGIEIISKTQWRKEKFNWFA